MNEQAAALAATREALEHDAFATSLQMQVEEVRLGYCRTSVVITAEMLNGFGVLHGGLLFTLADYAFSGACNSHGRLALALNVNISYLGTVEVGTRLVAEAQEEYLGERTGLYHMTVSTTDDRLIASCQGVAYRKKERHTDALSGAAEDGNGG